MPSRCLLGILLLLCWPCAATEGRGHVEMHIWLFFKAPSNEMGFWTEHRHQRRMNCFLLALKALPVRVCLRVGLRHLFGVPVSGSRPRVASRSSRRDGSPSWRMVKTIHKESDIWKVCHAELGPRGSTTERQAGRLIARSELRASHTEVDFVRHGLAAHGRRRVQSSIWSALHRCCQQSHDRHGWVTGADDERTREWRLKSRLAVA